MIDHVSIPVDDFPRAAAFYDAVLATLGYRRLKEREGAIGFGFEPGFPPECAGIGLHISFRAESREQVHSFHRAALTHGGTDAGAPGSRPHYTAGFYGAFAFDPEGFKIEAVLREALPKR